MIYYYTVPLFHKHKAKMQKQCVKIMYNLTASIGIKRVSSCQKQLIKCIWLTDQLLLHIHPGREWNHFKTQMETGTDETVTRQLSIFLEVNAQKN